MDETVLVGEEWGSREWIGSRYILYVDEIVKE